MTNDHVSLKTILLAMTRNNKLNLDNYPKRIKNILSGIMCCHTPVYGITASVCPACGHFEFHCGSCNGAYCPACGVVAREKWIDRQRQKLVNSGSFHIVFTVPDNILMSLFRADPKFMYNALFTASAQALRTICSDPKYFGAATVGFFSSLHTWGAKLNFHPHIHTVLYGCGLDSNGNLVHIKGYRSKTKGKKKSSVYLCPVSKLSNLFKSEFLKIVATKYEYTGSPWLPDINAAKGCSWNVQINPMTENPDHVVKYLSRYMNRIAISDQRLLAYDESTGSVTLSYKNYRKRNHPEMSKMVMKDTALLKLFLMHIPPAYFSRFRHYGFLSNNSKATLRKIQKLTETPDELINASRTTEEILKEKFGEDGHHCRSCHAELDEKDIVKIDGNKTLDYIALVINQILDGTLDENIEKLARSALGVSEKD